MPISRLGDEELSSLCNSRNTDHAGKLNPRLSCRACDDDVLPSGGKAGGGKAFVLRAPGPGAVKSSPFSSLSLREQHVVRGFNSEHGHLLLERKMLEGS